MSRKAIYLINIFMKNNFVHLHVHSDYSLLDGAAHVTNLCQKAKKLNMSAIALTDHGNLFGAIDFFKEAKRNNIKPIIGCEIYLVYEQKFYEKFSRKDKHKIYHMGLIAINIKGYYNLIKLVSDAHTEGFYYKPRTDLEQLYKYSEGLVALSGCLQGVIPQLLINNDIDGARKAIKTFIDIFTKERFFIEIQDHGIKNQSIIIKQLLMLSKEFNLKVVCTNDVHYVNKNDWVSHDSLLCIQTGSKKDDINRMRYNSHQFYLKSYEEMLFVFKELPFSLKNTLFISDMCNLEIPFAENNYPIFNITEKNIDKLLYLKNLCIKGLQDRYKIDYLSNNYDLDIKNQIIKRFEYELYIINKTGFTDYFLIVWDIIKWAKGKNITVGPGRGSGAGCIIAYLLKITDIDPIKFNLFFERFLNPERISPPDFDIDFCMKRRGEVINYIREKYGNNCVANIITFGTFGAKMVIRDLARINNIPYNEANRLSKMIPENPGITLKEAIINNKTLQNEIKNNKSTFNIIKQGKIIEGMVRNIGTHAAGLIISNKPLRELIPLTLQDGVVTTQYSKNPLEELGMLKVDLLGLKTLTIISETEKLIKKFNIKNNININKYYNDQNTFNLLSKGNTIGVFQLESIGMQSLCRQFKPSNINEIIALIALYRPGPMEWIPLYIKRKNKLVKYDAPHELLKNICKETHGILVYQEQVMEAAKIIAGYTLGSADILRRAMGKKNITEMQKQRKIFIDGAKKNNNIDYEKSTEIFNILEKFSGYGFNKAHATCYAVLAYKTAYLKSNYPIEFMSVVLSSELGNKEKLVHLIEESSNMNIKILGPSINESQKKFTPNLNGSIRFGIAGIKGVGDIAASNILNERDLNGPFKSFFDFISRVDLRVVNKKVIESLIGSGSFELFKEDRQHLYNSLQNIINNVVSKKKDNLIGQTLLFDNIFNEKHEDQFFIDRKKNKIDKFEKLKIEKNLLGFYVSGHPMDDYYGWYKLINSFNQKKELNDILKYNNNYNFTLCGIITHVYKKFTKNNTWFGNISLSSHNYIFEIKIFPIIFEKFQLNLQEDSIVVVLGKAKYKDNEIYLYAETIYTLNDYINQIIHSVLWILESKDQLSHFLIQLKDYSNKNKGIINNYIVLIKDNKKLLLKGYNFKSMLIIKEINKLKKIKGVIGIKCIKKN